MITLDYRCNHPINHEKKEIGRAIVSIRETYAIDKVGMTRFASLQDESAKGLNDLSGGIQLTWTPTED